MIILILLIFFHIFQLVENLLIMLEKKVVQFLFIGIILIKSILIDIYYVSQLGISRSVTAIIGYLIQYENYSFKNALQLVKQKRIIANPNFGFIEQLKSLEKMKKKSSKK